MICYLDTTSWENPLKLHIHIARLNNDRLLKHNLPCTINLIGNNVKIYLCIFVETSKSSF